MLPLTVPNMNGPLIPSSSSLSLSNDNNINNIKTIFDNYRLIIHFDINETILIGDDAGGDTRDDCINKIIAKSAFVQIPESVSESIDIQYSSSTLNLQPTHWWDGTPIVVSSDSSIILNDDNKNEDDYKMYPPLCTDWVWPINTCPYYRTMLKDINPKPFIVNDGVIYKPLYDKIQKLLEPQFDIMSTYKNDYPTSISNIVPSFFHTLMILFPSESLSSNSTDNNDSDTRKTTTIPEKTNHYLTNYPISIVLRTMGSDLQNIASIITLFAQGKHPNYPDYKNSKLILHNTNLAKGRWKNKMNSNNPTTTSTTTESKTEQEHAGDTIGNNNDQYVWQLLNSSNNDNDCIIAENDTEVLNFIHSQTICGIQDDYMFWKQNNFQPWSGKPIWIENSTITNTDSNKININHHILLDDNIHNLLDYSIAGIRKETETNDGSFVFLNNSDILDLHGTHLIRVPTIEPILNPNWFIQQIEAAHMNFIGTSTNK